MEDFFEEIFDEYDSILEDLQEEDHGDDTQIVVTRYLEEVLPSFLDLHLEADGVPEEDCAAPFTEQSIVTETPTLQNCISPTVSDLNCGDTVIGMVS